jgi:hypothetical protein
MGSFQQIFDFLSNSWIGVVLIILFGVIIICFRVVPEYERWVVFFLGRCIGTRGPGLIFVVPFLNRVSEVGLRTEHIEVSARLVTKSSAVIDADVVVSYRILDPLEAVLQVQNYKEATKLASLTMLRDTLSTFTVTDLRNNVEHIRNTIRIRIDEKAEAWGMKITSVGFRKLNVVREGSGSGSLSSDEIIQDTMLQVKSLTDVQDNKRNNKFVLRILLSVFIGIVALTAVFMIPQLTHWSWLELHPNRLGLYGSTIMTILGVCWIVIDMDKERQRFAFGTLVVGALLVLVQIIGR